uniref:Uncharacterized protein n=1 Tax=Pipistrellus kuhlii TaxID=59472 RepID=A0A7J7R9I3_PIPKU|nr:hypothetical protein mPipKuh1_010714 [Pipistrellus kuhlii]
MTEGLPIICTLIMLLASMNALVCKQASFAARYLTFTVFTRFFFSVTSVVLNEDRALSKELSTISTFIGIFSSVNFPFLIEVHGTSKTFSTFVTLKIHFSRADTLMLNNFLVAAGCCFTFTPMMVTFSTEKFLCNLTAPGWLLSLESFWDLWKI